MSRLSSILRRSFCTSQAASYDEVSSSFIKSLSTGVYKERSFKRMVEKIKRASEYYRFRTNTGIYEDAVRRLAAGKRFDMIEEVLENQKKYHEISREGYAVRIITLYGKSGMFQHASKTFDEMPERKCDRTIFSFNALLGASVNCKKLDEAEKIFREYPAEMSIKPDLVSYNTVIKGHCEMGCFNSAISMLDEMEKNGLPPDLVTFNTLLFHLYMNDRFSDGEMIWARMGTANIFPDARSYTARVEGLGKQKRMAEAVSLFEEMRDGGIKPDGFTYNAFIKGFCNAGDLEEAMKWFDEMENRTCSPGKAAFKNLIPLACERGNFDLVLKLCRKVFEHRCLVGSELLEHVLDCLVKESRLDEAKELVELANSSGYCKYKLKMPSDFCTSQAALSGEPSSSFIRSLTTGVYKERNLDRMIEKIKQASEYYQFRTKTGIYEDAIRRLAADKRFDMIEEILENQKNYQEFTQEGYSVWIITLYGKSGMFQHASKTFDEMPERKCERTILSFNALLEACISSKKFNEAERIFREYPTEISIKPDTVSYNTVIKGYCKMGSFDSAISMLDEMEKNGLAPDVVTFNILMRHLYMNDRFFDGEKIWARMEAANVVADTRSYTARVEGLGTQKRMAEAMSLFEEMRDKGIKADEFTYNALIKGFCNAGDLEEGMKWFDKIGTRIRSSGKAAFKNLIPLACEKGNLDVALKLCRKVFEHRCLVGSELLELVLDCLIKVSRIDEAKELVELANSNGYCKYKLKMPSE